MQRNEMDLSLASLGRRLPSFLPHTPSSPVQTTSTPVLRPGDHPVHLQTGSCHPTSLHTDQASVSIWKSHRLQDRGGHSLLYREETQSPWPCLDGICPTT